MIMKKKLLTLFILLGLMSPNIELTAIAADSLYQGHIEETNSKEVDNNEIFTNEVEKLEQDKTINLTVSQVLAGTTSVEGDEFFAVVSDDVLAGSGVILPVGTVAHGTIKNIVDPKRLGRDGYIELSFDYLITPDGREIPIEGGMTSKLTPAKSVAKTIGEDIAYTAVGGAYGTLAAIELLGLEGAIVSQGYTLLGGAALGGVIALGLSLFRKGKDVLISPGDEIKVRIKSAEEIPVMRHEALRQKEIKYEGLVVDITDIFLEEDPFGHLNTISIDLIIKNYSDKNFSTFDIALVNDLQTSYTPSIFTDYRNSLAMKNINKGDQLSGILSFSVDDPKRKHWLVFYDRKNHKPLAKISIDNAKKNLNISDLEKKKKKRKKV